MCPSFLIVYDGSNVAITNSMIVKLGWIVSVIIKSATTLLQFHQTIEQTKMGTHAHNLADAHEDTWVVVWSTLYRQTDRHKHRQTHTQMGYVG